MRNVLSLYLNEIQKSAHAITDSGVLDHAIAKILPVVTTLRTHFQATEELLEFVVTEKFAPAQKNETQLRFDKVKVTKKKKKIPLK